MMFIGVALLVAAVLALLISSDAGQIVGLSEAQTGQLLPLVILLVIFAGGAFARRRKFGELFGNLLIWVGIFATALAGYAYRDDLSLVGSRVFGELVPGVAMVDAESGTVVFRRGRGGHFEVNATINGTRIPLIFDTGASAVVLTARDARAVGIDTTQLRYNIAVSTANGTGRAAQVTLDLMEVGGIERRRVRAFIAEEGALDTSLLGMTFLETLERYTVSGNTLEFTG